MFAMLVASIFTDLWAVSAGLGSSQALKVLHYQPWLLGALSLGVGLARHLPLESIVLAAVGSAFLSVVVGIVGSSTTGTEVLSLHSLRIALVWLVLGVGSLGTVRLVLSRCTGYPYFGYGVVALTALLMAALLKRSEILDATAPFPIGTMGLDSGRDVSGAGLLGTSIAAAGVLAHSALMMQLLRNKRPVQIGGDSTPSIVLGAVTIWLEAAHRLSM